MHELDKENEKNSKGRKYEINHTVEFQWAFYTSRPMHRHVAYTWYQMNIRAI
jgi:hypothetical protein